MAQTFSHHFAGILIAAGLNQVMDNLFLVRGEHNVNNYMYASIFFCADCFGREKLTGDDP